MFNNRSLSQHVKATQTRLFIDMARQGTERHWQAERYREAVDAHVEAVIAEALADPARDLSVFNVEGTPVNPALDIAARRKQLTHEVIAAADTYARLSFLDKGLSLEAAQAPVKTSEAIRDAAIEVREQLERLTAPIAAANDTLEARDLGYIGEDSLRDYYGGRFKPLAYVRDPGYRIARNAIAEAEQNIKQAKRREPPFEDIRFGVQSDRPYMVARITGSLADNLAGIRNCWRLVHKANSKLSGERHDLEITELREKAESLDTVDTQVTAEVVERYRDPAALEKAAITTGDPRLQKALLAQVKAVALDDLSRSMFDHTMNAREVAFEDLGHSRRRGEARQYRTVSERNRELIGYQVHDHLLLVNAGRIAAAIDTLEQPGGATIAANKRAVMEHLKADDGIDPVLTARQLDQFGDGAGTADPKQPLSAEAVVDTARFLGYQLDEAAMAAVVQDQANDALPPRPAYLAPDAPLPKPRRL